MIKNLGKKILLLKSSFSPSLLDWPDWSWFMHNNS